MQRNCRDHFDRKLLSMLSRCLADLLVLLHLAFVIFVLAGGLLALRNRRWIYLHLPALAWGILVELMGWICPLTPWENHFRELGGEAGYAGGFVEQHLLAWLYPEGLTRSDQIMLGIFALILNLGIYGWAYARWRK